MIVGTRVKPLRIVVVSGGFSHEANYSATPWVVRALKQLGHDVVQIAYHDQEFLDKLRFARPDLVFPQCLGAYGEDGTLQGILDFLDIPYVGSGLNASALCANKWVCSQFICGQASHNGRDDFCAPLNYPLNLAVFRKFDFLAEHLGVPFVVKPMSAGASFGIKIVRTAAQFDEVVNALTTEFEWLVAEQFISGTEYSWGLIQDAKQTIALPAEIVRKASGFSIYSKEEKLARKPAKNTTSEDDSGRERVGEIGMNIATAMGIRSFVRMDAIMDRFGRVHVLDVNTLPGLVPGMCLLPAMCEKVGIDYTAMISMLVESAGRPQPMHMRKLAVPPPGPTLLGAGIDESGRAASDIKGLSWT